MISDRPESSPCAEPETKHRSVKLRASLVADQETAGKSHLNANDDVMIKQSRNVQAPKAVCRSRSTNTRVHRTPGATPAAWAPAASRPGPGETRPGVGAPAPPVSRGASRYVTFLFFNPNVFSRTRALLSRTPSFNSISLSKVPQKRKCSFTYINKNRTLL